MGRLAKGVKRFILPPVTRFLIDAYLDLWDSEKSEGTARPVFCHEWSFS
jgi:hypothetical protein